MRAPTSVHGSRGSAFGRHAAIAVTLAILGCSDRRADDRAPAPSPSIVASQASGVTARRPTVHYYLGRTAARCEVYSVDGDAFSTPVQTACPLDLFSGERIRIAGRTCMRESSDATRVLPVVCPDSLTNLEKQRRAEADAGAP